MQAHRLGVLAVVAMLSLAGGAATAATVGSTAATVQTANAGPPTPAAHDDLVIYEHVQEAEATVTFEDQNASDNTVTVQEVTLGQGGYVAIHDSTLLDGNVVGSVVGVSEYLAAGTHQDVTVTLFEGVPGATFDGASANGTHTFVAMPHTETSGDSTYSFVTSHGADDVPYVSGGQLVTDLAAVTFGAGTPSNGGASAQQGSLVVESLTAPGYAAPNTTVTVNATLRNPTASDVSEDVAFRLEGGSVDFVVHETVQVSANNATNVTFDVNTTGVPTDEYIHGVTTYNSSEFALITVSNESAVDIDEQETEGTAVTVDSVFLPEGGYVTVHDSTLQQGDAVGSVVGTSEYLEAGFHESVNVTLDEPLAESQTLVAMPHRETTGDTTYDFVTSQGTDDGPYTVDGQPVVEAANVTVTGNATA